MDVKDEQKMHKQHEEKTRAAGAEAHTEAGGICQRCQRTADHLYSVGGRWLCYLCVEAETGHPPHYTSDSIFGGIGDILNSEIKKHLGKKSHIDEKPKRGGGDDSQAGGSAMRSGFADKKLPNDKKPMDETRGMLAERRREKEAIDSRLREKEAVDKKLREAKEKAKEKKK